MLFRRGTKQVDLYGRRDPLQGAVTGSFGDGSDVVTTLEDDIIFERCDIIQTFVFPFLSAQSRCAGRKLITYGEEGPPVLRCLVVVPCTIKLHEQGR